jgi:hypothetical protein
VILSLIKYVLFFKIFDLLVAALQSLQPCLDLMKIKLYNYYLHSLRFKRTVSSTSSTGILVRPVSAQCENTSCVVTQGEGTSKYVNVIFM